MKPPFVNYVNCVNRVFSYSTNNREGKFLKKNSHRNIGIGIVIGPKVRWEL